MAQPIAQATGRRKTSVARVFLHQGTGAITVNGKTLEDYFPQMSQRIRITEAFRAANVEGRYDVIATVEGGGTTGQTDAMRLGIARALVAYDPEMRGAIKREGLLTRDSRMVERKKYGLRKARRAPQYTKR